MKKWTFLFVIATIIWSCDNNDEVKVKAEDQIIGNWELSHSIVGSAYQIGSVYQLSPVGGQKYVFNIDHTFIKSDLASGKPKGEATSLYDEGTWLYNEDTKQLNLTFKTYSITNEVSDTKLLAVAIEKITDKELVLKADYNKTNPLGEFVEFRFDHYLKK